MTKYYSSVNIPRIAHLGGNNWNLSNLGEITVLFGKNGCGKSVLLRSWRDKDRDQYHYIAPERSGAISFQPHFLQAELNGNTRADGSIRNDANEYHPRIIGRIQSYFISRGAALNTDSLPNNASDIIDLVSGLISDFDLTLHGKDPPYTLLRISDSKEINNIDELSSGEAQLFTLSLDIATIGAIWELEATEIRLLLIDEPDAHLHPDLIVRFADFLRRVVERFKLQVVIATHSTPLLSAIGQFSGSGASIVYMDRNNSDFNATPFDSIQRELAACLGGHILMGPLFGAPILLVEGDDDYRAWSEVPRHHLINIAVIPTSGAPEVKKYQKTLERIFASLRDDPTSPVGFALLDGDQRLPKPNSDNAQQHIKFIRFNCRELENLYLTDEVLAKLGFDWETAKSKIRDAAYQFGKKKDSLIEVCNADRKDADLKNLIGPLAQILDEKDLNWAYRLGKILGSNPPSGQLKEFLGDAVMEALWGDLNGEA